jgi:hypothetical protein
MNLAGGRAISGIGTTRHKPLWRHVRTWRKPTPRVAARAALRNLSGDMLFISRLARPMADRGEAIKQTLRYRRSDAVMQDQT